MKNIFHYIPLYLRTLAALVTSCSDTIEDAVPSTPAYTGLALAVPQATVSSAALSMNATEKELEVKDLWVFCFPQNNKGTYYAQELSLPSVTTSTDFDGTKTYPLVMQPGTYHVYVVANMGDKSIDTDGHKLSYFSATNPLSERTLNAADLTYDATK